MKNLFILSIIVVFALALNSCKKDEVVKTNMDYITQGDWRLKTIDITGIGPVSSELPKVDTCNLDDTLSFKRDFNFTLNDGTKRCDFSSPNKFINAYWGFKNNENTIVMTGGTYRGEVQLGFVDDVNLQFSKTIVQGAFSYKFVYSFVH